MWKLYLYPPKDEIMSGQPLRERAEKETKSLLHRLGHKTYSLAIFYEVSESLEDFARSSIKDLESQLAEARNVMMAWEEGARKDKAEIDRLQEQLNGCRNYQPECDRLKAELEKWKIDYREAIDDQDILRLDRDLWKKRAEGRAEILLEMFGVLSSYGNAIGPYKQHPLYVIGTNEAIAKAKEALAAYDRDVKEGK